MKTALALSAALLLVACSRKEAAPAPAPAAPAAAAVPAAPPPAAPAALGTEAQAIASYVDEVESEFREGYRKKEIALTPKVLEGITSAPWVKLDAYADQGVVKRLKLYPAAGSTKVEEFYFRDGQLVYVSDEPTGTESAREQYFFADGQLIEAIEADGRTATLGDAEKLKGTKLVAEAQAFLKLASSAP